MNKRHLHHTWRKIRPISAWYFLVLAIFFFGLGVYAMRQNNLKAIELRDAVIAADKANKDVEKPLRELREFMYAHMNTDLSNDTGVQQPIQLKYRYDRLVAKEKARVEKANESVYTRAQSICERRYPAAGSGPNRIACIERYVTDNGVEERSIPDALYKFDFASPRWSPDLAGWSMVIGAIFLVLCIVRFALERWLKHEMHEHE